MADKSGKKKSSRPPRPPAPPPADSARESENDRPTVSPPFDVEAFARASSPSKFPKEAPTRPPPARRSAEETGESAPSEQRVTLTNEVELEKARERSAKLSDPPKRITSSALSIADARAKSSPSVTPPEIPTQPASASIEDAVLDAIGAQSAPEITERTIEDPAAEMRERFSLGDYTGALEMSELILAEEPGNLEAAECGENCRSVLEGMFAAKLGPLGRVPMVVVPRTQMRWLSIDHRAGFILSLVDGSSTVDMILDVCGMPKLDALRILHELVQRKIVAFR
jgi:hypothetical protein